MHLRTKQACELTHLSHNTLTKMANQGIVKVTWIGGQRRFDSDDLELLMKTGDAPRRAVIESNKRTSALQYRRTAAASRARITAGRD